MRKPGSLVALLLAVPAALLLSCGGGGGGSATVPVPSGTLDRSFGGTGFVTHDNAAGGASVDWANSVALDNSGRVIVAGRSKDPSGVSNVTVWRYKPDGTPDNTFGGKGYVTHDNALGNGSDDWGYGVAIDGNGRIVVAGRSEESGSLNNDMVIWRFKPDGTPDDSFNGQGHVNHDSAAGGQNDYGFAVAVDGSNRIVVTGKSQNSSLPTNTDMVIWRYNTDGTLDTTFGGTGYAVHDNAAGGSGNDGANAVAIDGGGRTVTVGESRNPYGNNDMAIWRYDEDGVLDTTFGGTGYVAHDNAAGGGLADEGFGVTIDGSGRIVVAGESRNSSGNSDMAIWRYNDDGTLDPTLNGKGFVTHHNAAGGNGDDRGYSVAVDGVGRIVVAGRSRNTSGDYDLAIWRYNADGTPDATFGGTGYVTHDNAAGGSGADAGFGLVLAIDGSGRIIVAGESDNPSGNADMAIWRYNP